MTPHAAMRLSFGFCPVSRCQKLGIVLPLLVAHLGVYSGRARIGVAKLILRCFQKGAGLEAMSGVGVAHPVR